MCAALVLAALAVSVPVARADDTTDYLNSIQQTQDYINQINQNVVQTQEYITQVNDAATDGNFSGPSAGIIDFNGNLINGGYYYNPN
jgi:hypothetical protein